MKRIAALLASLATAISFSFLAAGAAGASVSPTPSINDVGEAGYYAGMNGPHRFTQVRTTFYLRNEAKGLGLTGGEGIQLCNDSSGAAVQLGVRWNGTGFQVLVGSGSLLGAADSDGTNATDCNSGGALLGVPLVPNLVIPQGHNVRLILEEVSPGLYEAFAKDITDNFSASKSFAGLTFPDEASAGVVQDLSGRSAPANLNLVRFRHTRAAGLNGVLHYLGDQLAWTAVQAYSTATGDNSNPRLVTPDALVQGRFHVFAGAIVGP